MKTYFEMVNSWQMYAICGGILLFLAIMCIVILKKSYHLGTVIGIAPATLKKVVISSLSFSVLPAVSVLIGMIALSGTLGVPMAWLRLSVIGALQYELQVTDISLQALGFDGMKDVSSVTVSDFGTIILVMSVGIIGGLICCIFALRSYMNKLEKNAKNASDDTKPKEKKKSFGTYATICMFVGLCSAYFGAYIGDGVRNQHFLPLIITCISGVCMLIFEKLTDYKGFEWIENFSLAASMLIGMAVAILIS